MPGNMRGPEARTGMRTVFQLEQSGNMFRREHTGDLQLYVHLPVEYSGWNIVLNVPAGTFESGKNLLA
jgi:hypothetical protein